MGAARSAGVCLTSQNGNIRVKSWQPLRLFIVYCLPALWRVNNGTPSLWAQTAAEDQGGQGVHRLPTLADASKDS